MRRNFSLFQQCIAYILFITVFLQSCVGGLDKNPLLPTREEQVTSVQTNTQAIIPIIDIRPLVDQTLITQEGHAVTFHTIKDELLASVRLIDEGDNLHVGLPVEVKQGADTASLIHLPKNLQQTRICVQLAQAKQPTKVVIYQEVDLIWDGKGECINKSEASSNEDTERKPSYKENKNDDRQDKDQEPAQLVDGLPAHFTYFKAIEVLRSNCAHIKRIDLSQEALDRVQLTKLLEALESNAVVGDIIFGEVPSDCQELKRDIEEKLVHNICNYRHHPSDYVHGLLASHVYKDPKEGEEVDLNAYCDEENERLRKQLSVSILPEEKELKKLPDFISRKWKVVNATNDINQSGYYSALYVNEATHQAVLTFQGTHKERWVKDLLIEDLQGVAGNKITSQQYLSEKDTVAAARYAKERGLSLSMTGHSLGGYLAELSVGYYYRKNNHIKPKEAKYYENNIVGIVFDSPGATRKLDSFKIPKEGLPITTYLSTPNIVNMCDEHLPDMYTVFPKLKEWLATYRSWDEGGAQSELEKSVNHDLSTIGKAFMSLYESHSLTTILGTFDSESGKPKEYARMASWPSFDIEKRTNPLLESGLDWLKGYMLEKYAWPSLKPHLSPKGQDILEGGYGLMTMIKDYNVNMEQPWTTLKYLDSDFTEPSDLPDEHKFLLKYQGGYEKSGLALNEHSVNSDNVINDCYNVDCLLYKLHQSREEINRSPHSDIRVATLQNILKDFEVQGTRPHFTLTNPMLSIRDLRSKMQRALEIFSAASIDDLIGKSIKKSSNFSSYIQERVKDYLPRIRKQDELYNALKESNICVVHGHGGAGKSSLVAEYGYEQEKKGTQVVRWIEAEDLEKSLRSYQKLARDLNIEGLSKESNYDLSSPDKAKRYLIDLIEEIYKNLENRKQPTLFILDNVNDPAFIAKCLLHKPKIVQIIITTQKGNKYFEDYFEDYRNIPLDAFTHEEAKEYIKKGLKSNLIQSNEQDIEALIHKVGSIPKKLALAVGYLKKNTIVSIPSYINMLKDGTLSCQVSLGIENCEPQAQLLMYYGAYLDPDFIPLSLIKSLLNVSNEAVLSETLNSLEELSLLTNIREQKGELGIRIHREVQKACKEYQNWNREFNMSKKELVSALLQVLDDKFPVLPEVFEILDGTWSQAQLYAPSIAYIVKNVQEEIELRPQPLLENLIFKTDKYYQELRYKFELECFHESLQTKQFLPFDETNYIEIIKLYDLIGRHYIRVRNYRSAFSYLTQAARMYHGLGIDRQCVASTYKNLVWDKIDFTKRNSFIYIENLGSIYNNLGYVCEFLMDPAEALKYYQQAYDILKGYGKDYVEILPFSQRIKELQQQNSSFVNNTLIMPSFNSNLSLTLDSIASSATNSATRYQPFWNGASAVKWIKALTNWCKVKPIVDINIDNIYGEKLLTLKNKCQELIQESSTISIDKWYVYSLEDMIADIDVVLKEKREIDNDTIKHFKKRLSGIQKDFMEEDAYLHSLNIPYRLDAVQLKPAELLLPEMSMLNYVGEDMPALTQ
jgi:KaiC/GvpD/RAD55 family RecA-like ATPase